MKRLNRLLPLWFCALLLSACPSSGRGGPETVITIGGNRFTAWTALTARDRTQGLMGVRELGPDEAMLFVFPGDQRVSFWMKDTPLPLSIAFIDRRGIIRQIDDMEPFSLRRISSQNAIRYVLEVNQGRFAQLGISVGDQAEAEGGWPRAED